MLNHVTSGNLHNIFTNLQIQPFPPMPLPCWALLGGDERDKRSSHSSYYEYTNHLFLFEYIHTYMYVYIRIHTYIEYIRIYVYEYSSHSSYYEYSCIYIYIYISIHIRICNDKVPLFCRRESATPPNKNIHLLVTSIICYGLYSY